MSEQHTGTVDIFYQNFGSVRRSDGAEFFFSGADVTRGTPWAGAKALFNVEERDGREQAVQIRIMPRAMSFSPDRETR